MLGNPEVIQVSWGLTRFGILQKIIGRFDLLQNNKKIFTGKPRVAMYFCWLYL